MGGGVVEEGVMRELREEGSCVGEGEDPMVEEISSMTEGMVNEIEGVAVISISIIVVSMSTELTENPIVRVSISMTTSVASTTTMDASSEVLEVMDGGSGDDEAAEKERREVVANDEGSLVWIRDAEGNVLV